MSVIPGERFALRGDLLDFRAEPALDDPSSPAVRWRPAHWVLVEDGRIAAVQPDDPPEGWPRADHAGALVLPGFIDTHVHSAQLDVIGSWGTQLLDWLHTHTFPAEQRMADAAHAARISATFLDGLLAVGTTSACVFPCRRRSATSCRFIGSDSPRHFGRR